MVSDDNSITNERDMTLRALQLAIQMEIEGKRYYLKVSQESSNELGKKLLQSLAREEDNHRQKFEEIYKTIQSERAWPVTDFQPDGGKRLRTIFTGVTEATASSVKPLATELDAVKVAIDMESKTHDLYNSQGEKAASDAERGFYEALAAEEREHQLILLDYYEYLKDPAGWFVVKEHPSLDGG